MAGLSAAGIGSGLDVNGLVSKLVAAERAPGDLRLNRLEAGAKLKLSGFAILSSAFERLKSALDAITSSSSLGVRTAASSDSAVFTASASSAVAVGSYDIEVVNLASAHKLSSTALAPATGLGAGTLHIKAGSKEFDVVIASGQDKPADIKAAITAAANAAGANLSASIVSADDGSHLSLSATVTGADAAITVTRISGSVGLDALVYDPGNLTSMEEKAQALDAVVKIDDLEVSSSTNVINNAITGLVLTLKKADPGVSKTLTIGNDTAANKANVQAFVTAYNGAVNAIAKSTFYDPATDTPSALTGDGTVRNASLQLRNAMGNGLALSRDALGTKSLGLTTNLDGTLNFDGAKFDAAMLANPDGVKAALSGDGGIASRLATVVGQFSGAGGAFTSRSDGLTKRLADVAKQREAFDIRMDSVENRYRKQFNSLDLLMSQLGSTSSFLTQNLSISNTR